VPDAVSTLIFEVASLMKEVPSSFVKALLNVSGTVQLPFVSSTSTLNMRSD